MSNESAPDVIIDAMTARHAPLIAEDTRGEREKVAEEIAAKADQIAEEYQASAVTHRDIAIEAGSSTPKGERHMRTAHAYRHKADGAWAVAHAAREIGGEGTS